MRQKSFADSGFEKCPKKTRKKLFLDEMQAIIPWKELCDPIEPYYPSRPVRGGDRSVSIGC